MVVVVPLKMAGASVCPKPRKSTAIPMDDFEWITVVPAASDITLGAITFRGYHCS